MKTKNTKKNNHFKYVALYGFNTIREPEKRIMVGYEGKNPYIRQLEPKHHRVLMMQS